MTSTAIQPSHTRHAHLVAGLREYLSAEGKSARWLGLRVAQDARLMPNLSRGQDYPARVMLALCERLVAFYERRLAAEQAHVLEAA